MVAPSRSQKNGRRSVVVTETPKPAIPKIRHPTIPPGVKSPTFSGIDTSGPLGRLHGDGHGTHRIFPEVDTLAAEGIGSGELRDARSHFRGTSGGRWWQCEVKNYLIFMITTFNLLIPK
jgi:hypothetical protein